jgi:16S rRNA (uracil1498-N3)-methyltransferase
MLSLFVVPEIPNSPTIIVDGDEAHHAIKVVRLNIGEEIILTDGRGNWAQGKISEITKKSFQLSVSSRGIEEKEEPELIVVQALTKSDRMRETIELLTVAGVDRIIPWKAERSIGHEKESSTEKWSAVSVAAAKQSRRVRFPVIESAHTTKEISDRFNSKLIILHESASTKISSLNFSGAKQIVLVIGPEGGISETEVDLLGGESVKLGKEVLRSSHAGFAALSSIQTLIHRW